MPITNGILTDPQLNESGVSELTTLLGMVEGDIGSVVTKALVGGRHITNYPNGQPFYSAFDVDANGDGTGYILEGAKPHWNVFSNNSPGMIRINHEITGNFIMYKLRPMEGTPHDQNNFMFNLGQFEGYKHASQVPTVVGSATYDPNANRTTVNVQADAGELNWFNIIKESYPILSLRLAVQVSGNSDRTILLDDKDYNPAIPYGNLMNGRTFINGAGGMVTAEFMFVYNYDEALGGGNNLMFHKSLSQYGSLINQFETVIPLMITVSALVYYTSIDNAEFYVQIAIISNDPNHNGITVIGTAAFESVNSDDIINPMFIDSPRWELTIPSKSIDVQYTTIKGRSMPDGLFPESGVFVTPGVNTIIPNTTPYKIVKDRVNPPTPQ